MSVVVVLKIHPKIAGGWIIIRNDSIGPFGVNAVIGDVAITLYIYGYPYVPIYYNYIYTVYGISLAYALAYMTGESERTTLIGLSMII